MDDDALDHGHDLVTWQRVFPGLQYRVAHFGLDEIHLADLALILLKSRDLLGVRRPGYDRPVALDPSGVVGRIAIVLDTVRRELFFRFGRDLVLILILVLLAQL
jgi:hypothetical protein